MICLTIRAFLRHDSDNILFQRVTERLSTTDRACWLSRKVVSAFYGDFREACGARQVADGHECSAQGRLDLIGSHEVIDALFKSRTAN